jgi:hypothetical protein
MRDMLAEAGVEAHVQPASPGGRELDEFAQV